MNCTSFEELIDELRGVYNYHDGICIGCDRCKDAADAIERLLTAIKKNPLWKVEGTFQDGEVIEVTGIDDDDCMEQLIRLEEKHGKLVWWTSENYPLVNHN